MKDATISGLRRVWTVWKRIGRIMGDTVGRVFLTLFHFTILVPFAVIARMTSDPLELRSRPTGSFWLSRTTRDRTIDDSRRLA